MKSRNPIINKAIENSVEKFEKLDEISLYNQNKVLQAFISNKVALRHFVGTSGYGYDDDGRDTLCKVVAEIFGAEASVASPLITSGTHAITLALFGCLRPGDKAVAVSGEPYDTLQEVIYGNGNGSLSDFGIEFESLPLKPDGKFDLDLIAKTFAENEIKLAYIQRSRGYSWRQAFSISEIAEACRVIKKASPQTLIFCDNCYGEFVEKLEPTNVGVDYCAGSFIKNIGGGLAPMGGYVVGKRSIIDLVAGKLTVPSIGVEAGGFPYGYRTLFQGLFNAPHTVNQALKTTVLFATVFRSLGYEVLPDANDNIGDIVCTIKLGNEQKIVDFCQAVQASSPVDGFVSPEPCEQPGYADKVIMAAGCFVQGASIELSCDAPIREPYAVYLQGGLTLEHGILALENVLDRLKA